MSNIKRHVGKIKNLGTRVFVVFRKLPDDPTMCLVVETDRLSDMYSQNLQDVVDGSDAQGTVDLFEVLNRNKFADGKNMLMSLHSNQLLRKIPVIDVHMYPTPSQPVDLALINAAIDEKKPAEYVKETPTTLSPAEQAAKLIERATYHETEAAKLREEAYTLWPASKPEAGRPRNDVIDDEISRLAKNEARREKYAKEKATKQQESNKAHVDKLTAAKFGE